MSNISWQDLAKELITAMDLGFYIQAEDGHRWLYYTGGREGCYSELQEALKVDPNLIPECKTYGGYREALKRVDEITKKFYNKSLLEMYYLSEADEEYEIWDEGEK